MKRIISGLICLLALAGPSAGTVAEDIETEQEVIRRPAKPLFLSPKSERPSEQLELAEKLLTEGRRGKAYRQYRALVFEWPTSAEAATAQQRIAEIQYERGHLRNAFDSYQLLVDFYAGQFNYNEILDRQYKLAVDVMNKKKAAWFFGGFTAPERAVPMLEKIMENAPNWKHAPNMQYLVGRAYEDSKQHPEAVAAYSIVMLRYPASTIAVEAGYRRLKLMMKMLQGRKYDDKLTLRIVSDADHYLTLYSDGEYRDEVTHLRQEAVARLAEKAYDRAIYYDRIEKRPKAALFAYEQFIKDYPSSSLAEQAKERVDALRTVVKEQP